MIKDVPDLFMNSLNKDAEFKSDKERKKKTLMANHATPIPTAIAFRMFIKHTKRPAKAIPPTMDTILYKFVMYYGYKINIQYMQNFVVQKKILTIHTEDRDIGKWPTSSVFAVDLPVEYKNVVSLGLADIDFPPIYVFSAKNQNLSMSFTYNNLAAKTITLTEGTYTGAQLATELQGRMNAAYTGTPGFNSFAVGYDSTSYKFVFQNPNTFQFDFTNALSSTIYTQSSQWGLGSYLGFEKKVYTSVTTTINYQVPINSVYYSIVSPYPASIQGEPYIYMELDLFNSMDEITPYTMRSNQLMSSKQSGKHNSSFAKIPRLTIQGNPVYVSKSNFLFNLFFNDPPLERVQTFKFKFRYHDGRLVDFGLTNFSFSIEITMLRPDSIKPPHQIQPNYYTLT